jgi:glucosamine--fructose-6-phosphate aminotransferase (isomerizing)
MRRALAVLALIAPDSHNRQLLCDPIDRLPEYLDQAQNLRWDQLEDVLASAQSLYVLGRGPALPIAQEAALKLKETSALHAEAYSAAEVMHGPMELVCDGFPIIVFSSNDQAGSTTASTVARLREAGANISQAPYIETGYYTR